MIFVGFSNGARLSLYLMEKLQLPIENVYYITIGGAQGGSKMTSLGRLFPFMFYENSLNDLSY